MKKPKKKHPQHAPKPVPPPTLSERLRTMENQQTIPGRLGRPHAVALTPEVLDEIHAALAMREVLPIPEELLVLWDTLSGAINRVETSLPTQLSANVDALIGTRREFQDLIYKVAMRR